MGKITAFYSKYLHNCYAFCLVWAFVLNFAIETLARKGLGGFTFLFDSPVVFFYNVLLIFATLMLGTLFRRRIFFITVISLVWLAIGITNGIILTQRMTPFTVKDLSSITDGATLLTNYFTMTEIVLIGVAIVAGLAALIVMWLKLPKKKHIDWKKSVAAVILVLALTFGAQRD